MKKNMIIALLTLISPLGFAAGKNPAPQVIEVQATEKGFEPSHIEVNSDTPVVLHITRKTEDTCATEIQFQEKKIKKALPLNETVSVDLGKLKKGDHGFACGMNMFKGSITAK
jgi:plastocyanin domain-containing protein